MSCRLHGIHPACPDCDERLAICLEAGVPEATARAIANGQAARQQIAEIEARVAARIAGKRTERPLEATNGDSDTLRAHQDTTGDPRRESVARGNL